MSLAKRSLTAFVLFTGLAFPLAGSAQAPAAPTSEAIGDWTLQCRTLSTGKQFCTLSQQVVSRQDKKQFLGVTIRQISPDGKLAMFIITPLGIFLGGGIVGKVDQGEQFLFKIHSCTAHGCGAAAELTAGLREAMIKGNRLSVGYRQRPESDVTLLPVSLKGFSKGLQRVGLK